MARLDTTGLDEVIQDMERMGQMSGAIAEQMVDAAAQVIRDSWKKEGAQFTKSGNRAHGDMVNSVGFPEGVQKTGNLLYCEIYPQGKDRKGVRNAEKAFILHYGKKGYPATHWVDDADANAEGPAFEACVAIWDSFIGN
jgi:hypothetical protein